MDLKCHIFHQLMHKCQVSKHCWMHKQGNRSMVVWQVQIHLKARFWEDIPLYYSEVWMGSTCTHPIWSSLLSACMNWHLHTNFPLIRLLPSNTTSGCNFGRWSLCFLSWTPDYPGTNPTHLHFLVSTCWCNFYHETLFVSELMIEPFCRHICPVQTKKCGFASFSDSFPFSHTHIHDLQYFFQLCVHEVRANNFRQGYKEMNSEG